MNRTLICLLVLFTLTACGPRELEPDVPNECERCEDWSKPQKPFRVHGNTWYVGTAGLSSFLIETDAGLILADGGLTQSAELIDANIRELGFDPFDIKAVLVSHAHFDHVGGIAAFQRLTRANVYTSEAGLKTLSSGRLGEDDPQYVADSEAGSFPPIDNISAVANGESVSIGSVTVKAVYTPGHTQSSVTWTWESCAMNSCYNVVYADSLTPVSAPGYSFSASGAADRIIESADIIADLDCDVLLSPHPFFFGMQGKLERRDEGNPFVNNLACTFYAESLLGWLEQRLDSERQ